MARRHVARAALAAALGIGGAAALVHLAGAGCRGWDPSDPFVRDSPEVDRAIAHYDAGELEPAEQVLTRYLGTGPCRDEGIGLTDLVRKRPDGSFDLGLTLFRLGERFGRPFGEEEEGRDEEGTPSEPSEGDRQRDLRVACGLVVAKAIASDPDVAPELRARAWYLVGNLEFLRRKYEDAVRAYDQALRIVPGLSEDAGVDGLGRDAAHNRAIALRRIEDQKDAGPPDAEPDAPPDAQPDAEEPDAGPEDEPDGGDGDSQGEPDEPDAGPDAGGGDDPQDQQPDAGDGQPDAGPDAGGGDDPQDQQPDAGDGEPDAGPDAGPPDAPGGQPPPGGEPEGAPKDPDRRQGERVLDQFEEAPSYQEQEAKRKAGRGRRTMEDK